MPGPKPHNLFSQDDLRKIEADTNKARKETKDAFERYRRQENEAQGDLKAWQSKQSEFKESAAELEEEVLAAEVDEQNAKQRAAVAHKKLKESNLRQQHAHRAQKAASMRADRAREQKEISAIEHERSRDKIRLLKQISEKSAECDLARGNELKAHQEKRQKERELQQKAQELNKILVAEKEEVVTTEDECEIEETPRPAGLRPPSAHPNAGSECDRSLKTTAVECDDRRIEGMAERLNPPRSDRSPGAFKRSRAYTPVRLPSKRNPALRLRSVARAHVSPRSVTPEAPLRLRSVAPPPARLVSRGTKRPNAETQIPQLRKKQCRGVSADKFYARIATIALYPEVLKSDLVSWLNTMRAHIICVHFIGDSVARNNIRRHLKSVVESVEKFEMCSADTAPMTFIFQHKHNHISLESLRIDKITSAIFKVNRFADDQWCPYAFGVAQAPPKNMNGQGANDFRDAMKLFHQWKVSFVSVHGITTGMVERVKAHLLLCNPMWRDTHADTAVADVSVTFQLYKSDEWSYIPPGKWEWAAIPHYLLSLAPIDHQIKLPSLNECSKVSNVMPNLGGMTVVSLRDLPATFPSGPPVIFPPSVQAVDLSADEDSNEDEPEDRQVASPISHVYQGYPTFFKALHCVQATFGKYENIPVWLQR